MAKAMIKGNEVRHGKLVYLDALSDELISTIDSAPLSENILLHLNDGRIAISPQSAQQVLKDYKNSGAIAFALRLQSDQSCIGGCHLANINWQARHAQLCMGIIAEAHFTSEILADAVQALLQFAYWEANFNRIYVQCVEDNILLRTALETVGFINEGCLRQEAFRNGEYLDICIYGILEHDWSS